MTVEVRDLTMTYRVPVRVEGLTAAVRSLFQRSWREIAAVKGISFGIDAGELVGFIGPNGAGKTTTLKMLSGILHPTGGHVRVLGYHPWLREPAYLRQIAMIRGSQPISGPSELTVMDGLRLQQLIYDVPDVDFHRNLAELTEMLDLRTLLDRQVRALSLGERMRCGLALSLVYRPRVLFLDEPTIGLDVSVVELTRQFLLDYCAATNATVLLTSHYMADVERLCRRVILIDHGAVAFDGELARLSASISPFKLVNVAVAQEQGTDWRRYGDVESISQGRVSIRVHQRDVAVVTHRLLSELPVTDLSIAEPPLERVIDQVYREGVSCAG